MPLPETTEFLRLMGVPDHWPRSEVVELSRLHPGNPLGFFEAVVFIKRAALP